MTSWIEQHLGSVIAALVVTLAMLGLDWTLDARFDFWTSVIPIGKSGFVDAMTKLTPTWIGNSLALVAGKEVSKVVIAGRKVAAAVEQAVAEERAAAAEQVAAAERRAAAAEAALAAERAALAMKQADLAAERASVAEERAAVAESQAALAEARAAAAEAALAAERARFQQPPETPAPTDR